jgi:nucleoid DNA-binding protein
VLPFGSFSCGNRDRRIERRAGKDKHVKKEEKKNCYFKVDNKKNGETN